MLCGQGLDSRYSIFVEIGCLERGGLAEGMLGSLQLRSMTVVSKAISLFPSNDEVGHDACIKNHLFLFSKGEVLRLATSASVISCSGA